MNTPRHNHAGGFTLIEIMVAMAIFGLVMAAIYSTWSAVIKASQTCQNVTAQVQRERIAGRTLDEALSCATAFASDTRHYGFIFENGTKPMLSFAAHLPKSFPRSGKYGDFDTRRVSFSVEDGVLLMRQNPIFMEMDEDELAHPLELARNVKTFEIQALNPQTSTWNDTWAQTNLIPKMISITVLFEPDNKDGFASRKAEGFQRVVALPAMVVQSSWQKPSLRSAQR
jgi:prepilin-type N-terminal cleavage/methylation domain-containing protein